MDNPPKYTNALINESSPYLLQHAHNPVNWMPWGSNALEQAQKENKLLLISIGYATCHWCHVMERESFEDEQVADLMNENFICIKVDREERPDVDTVYMEAVQMATGQGGWPLNCFALPDGKPFYGGTYFPKQQWLNVLSSLASDWKNNPQKIIDYAHNLSNSVKNNVLFDLKTDQEFPDKEEMEAIVKRWSKQFDTVYGGMQGAPKFPVPVNLEFLLHYNYFKKDSEIEKHIELSLKKMACGGLYDQVGGGFSRYSTDSRWKIPHFEKMLYDNAQLISLYSKYYSKTKIVFYKEIVEESCAFIKRELTAENGGFYAALDADSEGVEGKFYVWNESTLREILKTDFDWFSKYYHVFPQEMWEGSYVLHSTETIEEFALKENVDPQELKNKLKTIKQKLLIERSKRVRPAMDNKIITSWNCLMIIAYLDAYKAIKNKEYLNEAKKALSYLLANHLKENEIYHTNAKNITGLLEDYALFIKMLLAFYQTTFEEHLLEKAHQLTRFVFKTFIDQTSGLFQQSLAPELFVSKQDTYDSVIPSANSIMANNLLEIGLYYGNPEFMEHAQSMLQKVVRRFVKYPQGLSNWGVLLLKLVYPYYEIAVTGEKALEYVNKLQAQNLLNAIFACSLKQSKIPLLENRYKNNATLIYICEKGACKTPFDNVEKAIECLH